MYKNIKHFKGLNLLRFFAAYFVVLTHAEQIRMKYGLFHLKELSAVNNGGLAVSVFFSLSGFLITYLLLKEQKKTNTIAVKKFYIRRILRIWPLYFLLILIGVVILPFILKTLQHPYEMPYSFNEVILYFLFFSPFMVNVLFGHHLLEPLWSIGVEELFYILWAPLLKFFKNHILNVILGVIFLRVLLLIYIYYVPPSPTIIRVIGMLQFEAMAIGGLGAYMVYHKTSKIELSWLFSQPVQFVLILFILLRFFAFRFLQENSIIFDYLYNTAVISSLLMSTIFTWLIINISINSKSIINHNSKIFDFLGKISYGIYMYHMLIIFGIVLFLKDFLNQFDNITSTILFYTLLNIVVIITAFLSKKLFEDQFLKLKSRYR